MTARPRARRKAERPGEILEAAFEEFSEKGFVAARLEDVARRAGVTKGTIYVYFPTKEAVFLAMSEAFSKEMGARLAVFLAEAPKEEAALAEAALDYFYDLTADSRVGRMLLLLIAEGGRFPEAADANFQRCLGPLLTRLQEASGASESAAPLRAFPELLCAPALLLLVWRRAFGGRRETEPQPHLEAAKKLILDGIRPRPRSGQPNSDP
ncbi:TetR/AcrR family transcriptional regulator [Neomegalonema perideroedes]|uniref:TetR/AcrR family transcriptional regulator n=1 Tax=Neomegalonema perideroedes TaxID=217219 RepID=UPI0003805CAA|nr:TetR/AcrR family transcriptional regulator [Neomegalonema perideroedes]